MKTHALPITAAILVPLALGCLTLAPQVRATCQEGCLTNNNTVLGEDALLSNTTGFANIAIGFNALESNTTGSFNTAVGYSTMNKNTEGQSNTALGYAALIANTSGSQNTALGYGALFNNTGDNNTAVGGAALLFNTTGTGNTANGQSALLNNTTGSTNTADGEFALYNTIGSSNIALGTNAGFLLTTGNNNIDIGNAGVAGESNNIRIGTAGVQTSVYVAGIRTSPLAKGDAIPVGVDADGRLGVRASSARYKDNIQPMTKSSEAILSLKPVTFRYKKELDPEAIPQFGLVAEDVAKIDPDLVARDDEGKPYTVRYEAVNAMLLNEFLKEHKKVEEQAKKAEAQASKIEQLETQLHEMAARLDAKGL